MHRKKRNRKPQDARTGAGCTFSPPKKRTPTTRRSRQKPGIILAEKATARLLPFAEAQAAKGNCRLLAELLRFLRPSRPVIMLAGKNVLPLGTP
jgi:hypothetical protein